MNDDRLERVQKNAVYLFVGVVIANIASFFFRVIIAREFGPDGFGIFSLAIMVTSIATMVALLGLPDGMITFVSRFYNKGDYERVVGVVTSSILFSIGTAIVLSFGLILIAPYIANQIFDTPALTNVLWWFAWIIPANVLIDLSAAYFLGVERGGTNTLIKQVTPKVTLLFFVLLVITLNGPIVSVGIAYLAATVMSALIGLTAVGLSLPLSSINSISIDARELLTYCLPLLATTATGFLLNWTDTIAVGYFFASDQVGIYQSSFILGANITIAMGAISGSLYPKFSSLFENGDINSIQQNFTDGTRWGIIISAAPTVYLIGFSRLSLDMIFGNSFRIGAPALMILVIGKGLILIFGPSTNLLKAVIEPRYIAITYGIAAILNIILNFVLVPRFGLIGAASATSAVLFLSDYLHFHRAQHYVDIQIPVDSLVRTLSAGLIAYLPSMYLKKYATSLSFFIIHIAVFSILYVIGLFVVGGIRKEEILSFIRSH